MQIGSAVALHAGCTRNALTSRPFMRCAFYESVGSVFNTVSIDSARRDEMKEDYFSAYCAL